MDNATAAAKLERVASLLEAQKANPQRVGAWRAAAEKLRTTGEPTTDASIASALRELFSTDRLRMLERLEGHVSPEDLFVTVPGVGPTLAGNVHVRLGLETLEDLERAALDGSLERVPGFGQRRIALVREAVAGMLQHSMRGAYRRMTTPPHAPPKIETLLRIDSEYRAKAERNELPRIAPAHFNPQHEAWLPVLHAEADGFGFTALYSNTARAHRLGRTHDWVVIYFERDGHESQCTVVTEIRGSRAGQRVVRGRENEQPAVAA